MGQWHDHNGRLWVYRAPMTVAGVLHLDAWALLPLRRVLERGESISSATVEPLLDALEQHVLELHLDDGVLEVSAELLDRLLDLPQWLELYAHMMASVSLEAELLEHMEKIATIIVDGGCACPACEGKETKRAVPCRFEGIPMSAHQLMSKTAQLEQLGPDAPWWTYQIKQVWAKVIGKQQREQLREVRTLERQRKIDAKLKKRGLWR